MDKKFSRGNVRRSLIGGVALALVVAACNDMGPGSLIVATPTPTPTPSPTAAYLGLGAPAAFVAEATPLPDTASEFDRQMQLANLNVGDADDILKPRFCFTPEIASEPALSDASVVPPTQLFDDFYYVGQVRYGAFVLRSDDGGYILFDTIGNTEAQTVVVPGLQQIGIDPRTLRSIQITHGHGDHDGGANYLQQTYRPASLYASTGDYVNKNYTATHIVDSNLTTPFNITVGGRTFTMLSTPGHTAGTLSYIVPVRYKGQEHKVAYWGGSGFPRNAPSALQYLRSSERMYDLVRATGADASVNSHTFFDKSDARITAAKANGIAQSNPMIQGNSKIRQSFSVLRQCAAALLSNLDPAARNAPWRWTKTDVYAARVASGSLTAAARVSNAFSVIAGVPVTFTASTGGTCTATTDTSGVAACAITLSGRQAPTSVSAAFAGKTTESAVDLDSTGSRTL